MRSGDTLIYVTSGLQSCLQGGKCLGKQNMKCNTYFSNPGGMIIIIVCEFPYTDTSQMKMVVGQWESDIIEQ